ncbi:MAG TPA: methylmalonyl Co-A mutase-associated GTPase MeaB [Patescibacteria group bacterium]|nr:methylmalonyl Co-A mutase-associated GTPase MeaB [Patescibacteria group bacterium]
MAEILTENFSVNILNGSRRALAKAMSLVESSRESDFFKSQELLLKILPKTGNSLRIGITGSPGVGKSTLIEEFGLHLIEQGKRVAVLAIDPSSRRSGGSILGDKVRMPRLAREHNAFIRPSPSGGALGGVARKTRECMLLCEAAGFDVIIVETVGVGQSETEVSSMVDLFMVLLLPNAGDEIQGIKRGIMELADLVVITKSDGEYVSKAEEARRRFKSALRLMLAKHNGWRPKVLTTSAVEAKGINDLWTACWEFYESGERQKFLKEQRRHQTMEWLHQILEHELLRTFYGDERVVRILPDFEKKVFEQKMLPARAAHELLKAFQNLQ